MAVCPFSLSINPNKVRKGSQNRELRSLSAYLFKAVSRPFAGLWVSAAASVGALFVRRWRTAPPAPRHLLKKVDENFIIRSIFKLLLEKYTHPQKWREKSWSRELGACARRCAALPILFHGLLQNLGKK